MPKERKKPAYCKALPRRLVIVVLALMLPLFFTGGPDWSAGPLEKSIWNLGHPLFFGLLVFVVAPRLPFKGLLLWLATTGAVLLLGLVIELLQGEVGRTADWRDLGRNLIGAWVALAWCHPPGPTLVRIGLRGATLVLLAVELMVVAQVGVRQIQLANQLPALFDFHHHKLAPYWSGQGLRLSDHLNPEGRHKLILNLGTGSFSGATLHNLPGDWRGYQALRLVFDNPEPRPLTLTLRVHDLEHDRGPQPYHDRFNHQFTLSPGHNELVIPLEYIEQSPSGRPMDMAHIRRLGLFASALEAPRRVYLLELRLE